MYRGIAPEVLWGRITFFSNDARWRDTQGKVLSDFARNRGRSGCGSLYGGPQDSTSCRTIDIASHRDAGFAAADSRRTRDPAASVGVLASELVEKLVSLK
jgi:hypothetical protein